MAVGGLEQHPQDRWGLAAVVAALLEEMLRALLRWKMPTKDASRPWVTVPVLASAESAMAVAVLALEALGRRT